PERYALELVLDAEAENANARALNYVSMAGGEKNAILLHDELTGLPYEVQPKLVINAAGPWIDMTNRNLGFSTRYIGGTKGSHIVVDNPELRAAIDGNEFFFENKDGRIVLIYPLFDRVLIGTTDIKIENPDEARCTDEEVDYFISFVARVFPSIKVTTEQIVFRFSGVRPLASSGAKTTGQFSRDHHIEVLSGDWTNLNFPVYSLVGGKWTSFRAFSEQVTDKALAFLERPRQKNTRELSVGGGHGFPRNEEEHSKQIESLAAWTGLKRDHLKILFERYGTRSEVVADFIKRGADGPLKSLPDYTRREIMFLGQHEKIEHLDDIVLRRTMLAMLGRLSKDKIVELADVLGDSLGWSSEQKNAEAERTLRSLSDRHGVRF
ncbi:MAG TPA: FAD-dependent oxidoreductase, partial [Anaerolineales bacterium]|nr:FAD-dependent oxidoreductase [Anaerolineales bacterium]